MDEKPIHEIGAEPSAKVVAGTAAQVISGFIVSTIMWIMASNGVEPPAEWVAVFTAFTGLVISGAVMWFKRDYLRDYGKHLLQTQAARGQGVEVENDADNEHNITRTGGDREFVGSTAI